MTFEDFLNSFLATAPIPEGLVQRWSLRSSLGEETEAPDLAHVLYESTLSLADPLTILGYAKAARICRMPGVAKHLEMSAYDRLGDRYLPLPPLPSSPPDPEVGLGQTPVTGGDFAIQGLPSGALCFLRCFGGISTIHGDGFKARPEPIIEPLRRSWGNVVVEGFYDGEFLRVHDLLRVGELDLSSRPYRERYHALRVLILPSPTDHVRNVQLLPAGTELTQSIITLRSSGFKHGIVRNLTARHGEKDSWQLVDLR